MLNSVLIFILSVMAFGIPSLLIAKYLFTSSPNFVYAFFGFTFVIAQILNIIVTIQLNGVISITGGDIAFASLLFNTIILVIASDKPTTLRNLFYILILLGVIEAFIVLIAFLSVTGSVVTPYLTVSPELYEIVLYLDLTQMLFYFVEISVLFFFMGLIKGKIPSISGRLVLLTNLFIFTLGVAGLIDSVLRFVFMPNIFPFSFIGFLNYIVIGISYSPLLIIFVFMEKVNFNVFTERIFSTKIILFASKDNLMKQLEKAHDEIEALQVLIPFCPSCKKVRDDKGYWDQLNHYMTSHSKIKFDSSLCPDCMQQNHKLILSYFDFRLGPKTLLSAPDKTLEAPLNEISSFMDFNPNESFFVHSLENFDSANRTFSLKSDKARGNRINLLLSYVVKKDKLDPQFAKDILQEFIPYIQNIDHIEDIFLKNPQNRDKNTQEKFHELKKIFNGYFDTINEKKTRYYIEKL